VILANEYSNSIFYEGVADAIADKDVDLRLFGKPDSRPLRRMGVALLEELILKLPERKLIEAAIKIVNQ